MAEVHVKGLKDLQKFLDQLAPKMEANIMRGALRAGMRQVQETAKAGAAVASGQMRDGLRVYTRIKGGKVIAGLRAKGKHGYLAHWIEFGTVAHEIRPKGAKSLFIAGLFRQVIQHPGVAARPFMRPALDSRAHDAVIATGEYIKIRLARKHGLDTADIVIEGDE